MNDFGSFIGLLIAVCISCTNLGCSDRSPVCCASWMRDTNALLIVGNADSVASHEEVEGIGVFRVRASQGIPNSVYCEGSTCWIAGGKGARGFIEEIDPTSGFTRRSSTDAQSHGPAYSVVGRGDQKHLYVAHATGDLSVVDAMNLREESALPLSSSELYAVARDADSGTVFVGDERGALYVVTGEGTPNLLSMIAGSGAIFSLVARGDGRVVVGRSTGEIELLDVRSGGLQTVAQLGSIAVMSCAPGSARDSVVCGASDGRVISVNLASKVLREVTRHPDKVVFVHSVDDSGRGVSVSADGTVRQWKQ